MMQAMISAIMLLQVMMQVMGDGGVHDNMLVKGIEPWSPWFHTNVLAFKPPQHLVKKYDT